MGKTYEKQISAGDNTPPPKSNSGKVFPTEETEANNQEMYVSYLELTTFINHHYMIMEQWIIINSMKIDENGNFLWGIWAIFG